MVQDVLLKTLTESTKKDSDAPTGNKNKKSKESTSNANISAHFEE